MISGWAMHQRTRTCRNEYVFLCLFPFHTEREADHKQQILSSLKDLASTSNLPHPIHSKPARKLLPVLKPGLPANADAPRHIFGDHLLPGRSSDGGSCHIMGEHLLPERNRNGGSSGMRDSIWAAGVSQSPSARGHPVVPSRALQQSI